MIKKIKFRATDEQYSSLIYAISDEGKKTDCNWSYQMKKLSGNEFEMTFYNPYTDEEVPESARKCALGILEKLSLKVSDE